MNQLYIDMDGVVSDFDRSIINTFGEEYSDRIADKFWKQTCVDAEVFRRMPPIEIGVQMVHQLIAAGHNVCFMTSTGGMPHHIDIAKQKLDWLHTHGLGDRPIAFCMNTQGKGLYAQPGAILIDDRQKVCDAWDANGGCAWRFTPNAARVNEFLRSCGAGPLV